jgi:hypothetical protein
MATRDRIVSTAAVVGVRTPSLCSFYLSLSLSLYLSFPHPLQQAALHRHELICTTPPSQRERERLREEKEGIGNKKERKNKGKVTKRKKNRIHSSCTPTILMSPSTLRL